MNILIRTDASRRRGTGHVMRCVTLADQLSLKGAFVHFICREEEGNLVGFIGARGYGISVLPATLGADEDRELTLQALREQHRAVDWMIVDHYDLDASWESPLRSAAKRLMVIDDLANRPHSCDLLLDQNLFVDAETRYRGLVSLSCRTFLGPRYALLRPEFVQARKTLRERDGSIARILVSFGGGDATSETSKALAAIRLLNPSGVKVDVAVGAVHPSPEAVKRLGAEMQGVAVYENPQDIARLMAMADLAIGAGGTSTWERCLLSLPALTVVVAENQAEVAETLARKGATINLGWHERVSASDIADKVDWALKHPSEVKEMGVRSAAIMGSSPIKDRDAVARAIIRGADALS